MPTEKSVDPWFLYILKTKENKLYTGITTNWQRRFEEHSKSGLKAAKALRGKGPLQLQYCVKLPSRRLAMQAEIWVKKQSRANKQLIIIDKLALPFDSIKVKPEKITRN